MANISYSSPSRKILFLKKKKFPFGRNLDFSPSPLPNKNRSFELACWKENRDYDSSGSILHFSTRRSSRETKKRFDRGDYRGFIRAWISPTHLPYRLSWLPKKRLDYRKRSIPLDRFNPKSGIDLYLILDREGCRLAVK